MFVFRIIILFLFAIPKYSFSFLSAISQHFTYCTLIIIQESTHEYERKPSEWILDLNHQTTGYFIFNQNFSPPTQVMDLHQQRTSCTTVYIKISSKTKISQKFSSSLTALIPKLSGIVKKDQDFFTFSATRHSLVRKIAPIASNIKYKLIIIHDEEKSSLKFFTTCLYCNKGSQSTSELTMNPNDTKIHSLFPDSANNFFNKSLRVSTPRATWLTEIRYDSSTRKWNGARGIFISALSHLMRKFNFSCEYFPSIGGGGTGIQLDNGTWIGVVGDVLYKNADLGQAAGQSYHRNQVISYSTPVVYEWLTFVTSKPQPYYSWRAIFWSFQTPVWILILCLIGVSYSTYLSIIKLENKSWYRGQIMAYMLSAMIEQDVTMPGLKLGRSMSLRVFVSFFSLFAIVVASAYKSKLMSLLAFPVYTSPPTDFTELSLSQFNTGLYYMKGAAYDLLKTSTNPSYKKIFREMELIANDVECIQKAMIENFACIMWANIADYAAHRNLSDRFGRINIQIATEKTTPMPGGFLMEKMAVFRNNFDRVLYSAAANGLLNKWRVDDVSFIRAERIERHKIGNESNEKPGIKTVKEDKVTLTMKHLSGSFFLYLFFHVIAIVIFSHEKIYDMWQKRCVKITLRHSRILHL